MKPPLDSHVSNLQQLLVDTLCSGQNECSGIGPTISALGARAKSGESLGWCTLANDQIYVDSFLGAWKEIHPYKKCIKNAISTCGMWTPSYLKITKWKYKQTNKKYKIGWQWMKAGGLSKRYWCTRYPQSGKNRVQPPTSSIYMICTCPLLLTFKRNQNQALSQEKWLQIWG